MFMIDPGIFENLQPAPKVAEVLTPPKGGRGQSDFANILKAEIEAQTAAAEPKAHLEGLGDLPPAETALEGPAEEAAPEPAPSAGGEEDPAEAPLKADPQVQDPPAHEAPPINETPQALPAADEFKMPAIPQAIPQAMPQASPRQSLKPAPSAGGEEDQAPLKAAPQVQGPPADEAAPSNDETPQAAPRPQATPPAAPQAAPLAEEEIKAAPTSAPTPAPTPAPSAGGEEDQAPLKAAPQAQGPPAKEAAPSAETPQAKPQAAPALPAAEEFKTPQAAMPQALPQASPRQSLKPAPSAGGEEKPETRPPSAEAPLKAAPQAQTPPSPEAAPSDEKPQARPQASRPPVAPAPSAGGEEEPAAPSASLKPQTPAAPEALPPHERRYTGPPQAAPATEAKEIKTPQPQAAPAAEAKEFKTPQPQAAPAAEAKEFKTAQAQPQPQAMPQPRQPLRPAPELAPSAGGEEEGFAESRPAPAPSRLDDVFFKASLQGDPLLNQLTQEATPQASAPSPAPVPRRLASLKRDFAPAGGWNSLASGLLAKSRLNLASGQIQAPALGREGADPAALTAALDQAKTAWPAPFRQKVGLGLVALGRQGLSPNSMTAGASLLGASSSGEVLRSLLGGLQGELKILKLPLTAREDLGRILADSGMDQERLGLIMSGFGRDGLSLEDLNRSLSGLNLSGRGRGLTATDSGLAELGQFLGSLGASTEVIDQVLNGLKPGQPVTGETLRDIFNNTELGGLSRDLGPGDLKSLVSFLQKMGATPASLEKLENLLLGTSGQLPMAAFLDFMDGLKEGSPGSGQDMEALKSLLEHVQRDKASGRTPIFNEILIKLEALGDAEIDDDFLKLSPALQALRGGFTGSQDFTGSQGQSQHRENQERYRQVFQAMTTGQDGPVGAAVSAQAAGGSGGLSEPLARQIAQKIMLSRRRGIYRLKMNLNPAELGRLDIELAVKNGALTARIRAENRAAYEALGNGVDELKKALAEGGLKLADLTLDHEDSDSGQSFRLGLAEMAETAGQAADPRTPARPGEVSYLV